MTDTNPEILDMIGIGFGPSNLALAIALKERKTSLNTLFLETKPAFAWHPDMMIPGADMQVSFLKDLVSLRDPCSGFSFLNYLQHKGRLSRFINRKTFFPSREEFNDYLGWAAAQFTNCRYDSRVTKVVPVMLGKRVTHLALETKDSAGTTTRHFARNLVLAPGGAPYWPDTFDAVQDNDRVIHACDYLSHVQPLLKPDQRIAVIGAGQSAAEIFADLSERAEQPQVDMILRARAIRPSDDTPFVNEVFDPNQTNRFHALHADERAAALRNLAATNYAVTDADLIAQIYDMLYEQDVRGHNRLALRSETKVFGAEARGDQIALRLSGPNGQHIETYDMVVLATGYRRALGGSVLANLSRWQTASTPRRDYRLPMSEGFGPAIFVQGYSEPTHGLSDTLLSVLALRSDEIAQSLGELATSSAMAAE